ncbi:hypothetical protein Tco_0598807 [Tanacetum coccineum]
MECGFCIQKGGRRGRGVKEKQHGLANDTIKGTFVVSSILDEIYSWNKKGTHEGNVGKTLVSSNADLNIGTISINIIDSHTSDANNVVLILSWPVFYAKLVTGEPSRKCVNIRTLIAPMGNRADVAILLESI